MSTRASVASARLVLGEREFVDVALVGVRWPIERDSILTERGVLHALRVRIENRGGTIGNADLARITVATAAGRSVEVDALLDLDGISGGEVVEGWLVFELARADSPKELSYTDARGEVHRWRLDEPIEQKRV